MQTTPDRAFAEQHQHAVAAGVVVVGGVQRLVHVADQVQQKLEGDRPLRRGPRIAQLRRERVDAVDGAGLRRTEAGRTGTRRMAEAGRAQVRVIQLDIDEVRWSLSAGQFGGFAKLGPGSCQAANLSVSVRSGLVAA